MDRNKLVETMAEGMYGKNWDGPPDKAPNEPMKNVWRSYCRAALDALERAGLVVVPRQENSKIIDAGLLADIFDGPPHIRMELIYSAMISAALGEK